MDLRSFKRDIPCSKATNPTNRVVGVDDVVDFMSQEKKKRGERGGERDLGRRRRRELCFAGKREVD